MYWEDVDLCERVRRAGWKTVFVPDAEVVHHGGCSSQNQISDFSAGTLRVAGETYFRLNHNRAFGASYRLLQAVSALVRLTLLVLPLILASGHRRVCLRASAHKWMTILIWAVTNELPSPIPTSNISYPVAAPGAVAFAERRIQAK